MKNQEILQKEDTDLKGQNTVLDRSLKYALLEMNMKREAD